MLFFAKFYHILSTGKILAADKKILFNSIGIALFAFFFIIICYWGLPVDFNADYIKTHIRAASISDSEIIKYTINPFTPVWFYPDDGRMEFVRPLQVLLFNQVHRHFPYTVIPFHYIAGIGHALLALVFYGIILYWTKSHLYGWLSVLLYTSFPSNYFIMSSVCPIDFQYYISVLTIATLVLFGLLTLGKLNRPFKFLAGVLLWVICVWIGIKIKSTEKIIPLVCFAFLIVRFPFVVKKIGKIRIAALLGAILFTFIMIVPVKSLKVWGDNPYIGQNIESAAKPATRKDKVTFSFNLNRMIQRTFFVPGENFPFITPYRDKTPKSVTGNYGFFIGWFFWIALLMSLIIALRPQKITSSLPNNDSESFQHFYLLLLAWFGSTIAGFSNGIDLTEIRLLNFAYVPSMIILFVSAYLIENQFLKNHSQKKWFRIVLTAMVIVTTFNNYGLLTKLIGHFGGMQDTIIRAETGVFRAVKGNDPVGSELYTNHQNLESHFMFIDWYDHDENWFVSAKQKLDNDNNLYFLTRNENAERLQTFRDAGYRIKLMNRYSFFDSKPPIFHFLRLLAQIKEKLRDRPIRQEILVYHIEK